MRMISAEWGQCKSVMVTLNFYLFLRQALGSQQCDFLNCRHIEIILSFGAAFFLSHLDCVLQYLPKSSRREREKNIDEQEGRDALKVVQTKRGTPCSRKREWIQLIWGSTTVWVIDMNNPLLLNGNWVASDGINNCWQVEGWALGVAAAFCTSTVMLEEEWVPNLVIFMPKANSQLYIPLFAPTGTRQQE